MKLRVMIVENENILACHIERMLLRDGHEVIAIASTPEDALDLAEFDNCDLLIVDIAVPGERDAVESAEIIRNRCGCQILFVTSHWNIEILERVADLEFTGFLVKPFREDELEALVQLAAIRRKKENHQNIISIDSIYSYCFKCATLFRQNRIIELTEKEHRFLRSLLESGRDFLSYEQLDQLVWGEAPIDSNTRRQLVYRFRQKAPRFPLKLVKGFGYRIKK